MLPQIPFKVRLHDEYVTQKVDIGGHLHPEGKVPSNKQVLKQKSASKSKRLRAQKQSSASQSQREPPVSESNYGVTSNQQFKVNVDINSRNVLIHIPDYVGREKINTTGMQVTSRFTDQIKILNTMIFREQERIMSSTQQDGAIKKPEFMTEVPEQRAQTMMAQSEDPPEREEPKTRRPGGKRTLTIGGEKNRVPKFGQRACSKQEHIQRVLSRENTQIVTPNLVPTLQIKKQPLQNYLNAYLANYKPFLKGERDNLPQILKNIINNIQQPSHNQTNEILKSQKFQEAEENINTIFVKQQQKVQQ